MCGIAGIVGPGAQRHEAAVGRMVAALEHRGPDERGVVAYADAVLGTARLAIVNPESSHQPLRSPDGDVAVVCNGELYGYPAHRARHPDYPFATEGDVELALAVHARHGHDFVRHLPGTFSLALWDDRSHRLVLARDRFGERPLYWTRTAAGELVFASELRALLASGLVDATVDRWALSHALRQGFVPPGGAIWEGVASVPPAHRLDWAPGAEPTATRWWDLPALDHRMGHREAVARFRELLDGAVVDQLEADVPVGAFLSGGIDSSTVAILAGRHHPGIHAFCFDMGGDASELRFARDVAERHGIRLHVLEPSGVDLTAALLDVSRVYDEPFGDSSALPTWLLCGFARQHVKVSLTGDGADELLGGYLVWSRGYVDGAPATGPRRRWWRRSAPPAPDVARRYAGFRQYFDQDELTRLGLPPTGTEHLDLDRYRTGTADDLMRFDLETYLPGDILVKTDRASMAHGLEVRSPFLDAGVAGLCISLPPEHKVDATHEKLLLRDAFSDLWPESIRDRRKQGFGVPFERWLHLPAMQELTHEVVHRPSSPLYDLVDREGVASLDLDAPQRLWNLLMVGLWWQAHRPTLAAR